MNTLLLNGSWKCLLPDGSVRSVAVPGCLEQVMDIWSDSMPAEYETNFIYSGSGQARLRFDGVSYFCQAELNGVPIGTHEGMWDSFILDCDAAIRQGENVLKLMVTKPGYHQEDRFPLRSVLSGFIPDVLTTFGGIWDDVELLSDESLFVYRHFSEGKCNGEGKTAIEIEAVNAGDLRCILKISDTSGSEVFSNEIVIQLDPGIRRLNFPFEVPSAELWNLDAPVLYRYEARLSLNGRSHILQGRFGFREISASGDRILLNGKAVYMRGILHWGYYDDLIIPNPGVETIRRELSQMKEFGFNAVKHCLYIPRKSYLDMMDELGMLAWVEMPLWLPEANPAVEGRIRHEYPRIFDDLQGHPCLGIVSLGCELNNSVQAGLLEEMYELAKREIGVLVRDNSGSGECYGGLAVDYADYYDYHFYAELPHLEQLIEHFTPAWRPRRPWLFGEFCDSDTMRDLSIVRKEKKVSALHWEKANPRTNPISILKPDFYLGRHDELMESNSIRRDMKLIGSLSIDHSLTHRKVTLEITRSFPEICGYNITNIRDVPIATSGMLDDLGQSKFPSDTFRRFNGEAVLVQAWSLARAWVGGDRVMSDERYNFCEGSAYSVRILLSNFTGSDFHNAEFRYRLIKQGETLLEGREEVRRILPHAQVSEVSYLNFRLPAANQPDTLVLEVSLHHNSQLIAQNDFPIFIYPYKELQDDLPVFDPGGELEGLTRHLKTIRPVTETELSSIRSNVLMSSCFTSEVRRFTENGGRLLLLQRGRGGLPTRPGPMWREGMIRPFAHPILNGIEKATWYDDLRYFSMTADTSIDSQMLDGIGAFDIVPVIKRYDCRSWASTDYLCTFRLGKGTCAASTLRFGGGLGKTPLYAKHNPFALYLFTNMLGYLRNARIPGGAAS